VGEAYPFVINSDVFLNVASSADMRTLPEDTGAGTLCRAYYVELLFRNRDMLDKALAKLLTDLSDLQVALNTVYTVTGGYLT
jgi:hypothetical protein